jgi:hypothetical protein
MNVVAMSKYMNRETVRLLQALTDRAAAGEITGVALCFRRKDGSEEFVSTDYYASRPEVAATATLRLSMKIAASMGEYDHSP